jgi:hypothetical protein
MGLWFERRAVMGRRRGAAVLALLSSFGCHDHRDSAPRVVPSAASVAGSRVVMTAERPGPSAPDCDTRIAGVRAVPALAPAELPARTRAELLARAKASAVYFVEQPAWSGNDPVVREWRRRLEASTWPGKALAELLRGFRRHPAFLRDVLLTEGYLYAQTTLLGASYADVVTPGLLFREPSIVIERGKLRFVAQSDGQGGYVYLEGPERGRPARLLLFDRVWIDGHEPGPPRHADVRALREALGFEQLAIEHVTADAIVASATYGALRVPTLLTRHGAELSLVCQSVAPGNRSAFELARSKSVRRERAVNALRRVILDQVAEDLPFDEPKTEFGQEDGKLRQEWRHAYGRGANHYLFNEDRYRVFDPAGRPFVPQVCIDFVFDTFERAGGSWYAIEGNPRVRSLGRLSFDQAEMENRRSVEQFMELARRRPDWFELRMVPPEEQVPLRRSERFFSSLFEHRAEYIPGDVVVILGLRDDEKLHYHSFFVFDADPVTGMPTLVAGNSGRPRVRTLAVEMAPAPKRYLYARARPGLEWLEHVTGSDPAPALAPLRTASQL